MAGTVAGITDRRTGIAGPSISVAPRRAVRPAVPSGGVPRGPVGHRDRLLPGAPRRAAGQDAVRHAWCSPPGSRACRCSSASARPSALQVAIAVTAGSLLSLLPEALVSGVVAVLFLVGAVLLWRSASGGPEDEELAETAGDPSFLRVAAISFGVLFAAEWGDLSQLATAGLAARLDEPLSVFVGRLGGAAGGLRARRLPGPEAGRPAARRADPPGRRRAVPRLRRRRRDRDGPRAHLDIARSRRWEDGAPMDAAVQVTDLVKRYPGRPTERGRRDLLHRRARRGLRAARAQRRRQDDDDRRPHHPGAARRRGRQRGGRRRRGRPGDRAQPAVRRPPAAQPRPRADRPAEPGLPRGVPRHRAGRAQPAGRRPPRPARPRRPRQGQGRQLLGRHGPAAAHRPRAHARPAGDLPRRAEHRPRPAGPAVRLGPRARAARRRRDRRPHHARHGRGRDAHRPGRRSWTTAGCWRSTPRSR